MRMKKILLMFILMIVGIHAPLFAQSSDTTRGVNSTKQFESARQRITAGLRCGNDGVVESLLMIISRTKLMVPVVDVNSILPVIDSLSVLYPSPTIRYEAFLASTIINNPELFSAGDMMNERNPESFFMKSTMQLQLRLFGMNMY